MANDDVTYTLPDSIDIYDDGFQRSKNDVLSGDADAILREIAAGKFDATEVRAMLARSTTLKTAKATKPATAKTNPNYQNRGLFRNKSYLGDEPGDQPFRFAFQNYDKLTKPVEYFSPKFGENATSGMVCLPVAPEEVTYSAENAPEQVTSVAGIVFSHAGPLSPVTITMEGFFPFIKTLQDVPSYVPDDIIGRGYYRPNTLCSMFTTSMRAGQPLKFSIMFPFRVLNTIVSHPVVVTSFEWSFKHGHGQDRFYSMTLQEWIPQRLIVAGAKKRRASNGGGRGGSDTKPQKGSKYVIKKGDSLWKIADKFLGDGRKWPEIYKINKTTLNKSLKAHGQKLNNPDLIYPGVTIVIPPKAKK